MNQYLLLIVFCSFLCACGKKGPPEALEKSDYPRTYPKPLDSEPFPPSGEQNQKRNDDGL
jgi:hypothetical protein